MEDDICAEWMRTCAECKWVEKNCEHKLLMWIHGVDACGYRNGWVAKSGYLHSDCIFVCAQIKQGDKRVCNEYR